MFAPIPPETFFQTVHGLAYRVNPIPRPSPVEESEVEEPPTKSMPGNHEPPSADRSKAK
ncbi:MAG: hypothetical protein AAGJ40_23155 [Planctomycetota bacterium]